MLKIRAFTMIELLIVLTVTLLLFCSIVPSLNNLIAENRAQSRIEELFAILQYARMEAMRRDEVITFCKSLDQKSCGGDWRNGQIVIDANGNKLRSFAAVASHDSFTWQSSLGHNDALSFLPSGFTAGQQGSFCYCPDGKNAYSSSLIVERTGRMRIIKDSACIITNSTVKIPY